MSEELKQCPRCENPYGYFLDESKFACPECSFEWNPNDEEYSNELIIKDSNGNRLQNGDDVIVIKDLPVKGAPKPIKAGTKVKGIRLAEGDHDIDCKVKGFGSMGLKSEFVKKA